MRPFAAQFVRYRQLEIGAGSLSELYFRARRIVRAAQERPLPSVDRLPEFAEARLPLVRKELVPGVPSAYAAAPATSVLPTSPTTSVKRTAPAA